MMKRLTTAILGIAVLVAAGCDLHIPESVTVEIDQSEASGYQIPAGSRTVVVSEFWDAGATLDDAASGVEGLDRIDGGVDIDGDQTEALQFQQELIDIPVDTLASDSLALGSIVEPISVTIDVPDVGISGETVETDIPPIALPGTVTIPPITIPGLIEPNSTQTVPVPAQTINATGFTEVTFESGTLEGTVSLTNASGAFVLDVLSAEIREVGGDATTIVSASPITGSATDSTNATLSFDLAGKTLPSDFDVVFIVEGGGGDGSTFDLDTNFAFVGTTTLNAATGVDFSDSATGSYEVPVSSSLAFTSATIDPVSGGDLSIEIAIPTTGWSGVTTDVTVTLLQNSTVLTTAGPGPSSTGSPFVVDLSGITIENAPIQVDYTVDVTGTNADFTLDSGANEVSSTIAATVNQFSEVVIDESLFNTIAPVSQPIDESTRLLVDSVDFNAPTVSITLTNDLPIDIAIDITSTTSSDGTPITFTSVDNVFPAASTDQTRTWNIAPNPLTIDMSSLDLAVEVKLQDGTPGDGSVALGPVVPNTSLSVTGEVDDGLAADGVTPDSSYKSFDVSAITISSTAETGSYPAAADPGIDLSSLGTFLPDGVGLQPIEDSYLNFTVDLSDYSSSPSISIYAYADDDGDLLTTGDQTDLIGAQGSPQAVNPTSADTIPVHVDNLETVFNNGPSAMKIFYEVTANNITLVPGSNELVRAEFDAIVPLAITSAGKNLITGDDGKSIVPPMEDDILGRTGTEEDENIEGLLALAEEVSINFTNIVNSVGIGLEAELRDAGGVGPNGALDPLVKTIALPNGAQTDPEPFELTREDIQRIIDDDSFAPEINLYILDGDHSLLTNGSLELSAWLGLKVGGSYEVYNATESSDDMGGE